MKWNKMKEGYDLFTGFLTVWFKGWFAPDNEILRILADLGWENGIVFGFLLW